MDNFWFLYKISVSIEITKFDKNTQSIKFLYKNIVLKIEEQNSSIFIFTHNSIDINI